MTNKCNIKMSRNKGVAPAPPVRPKPTVKFSGNTNSNDGSTKVSIDLMCKIYLTISRVHIILDYAGNNGQFLGSPF